MRRSASIAILGLSLVLGMQGHAAGLSCAPPMGTPDELVASDWFFEEYDFAVVGTVRAIATNEDGNSPEYGRTRNTIDVAVVVGESSTRDSLAITTSDPGWMQGYGFVVGRSYFIPVQSHGPLGERNYSFLCDPIHEIDDVDGVAARLAALADGAGVPVASPEESGFSAAVPWVVAAGASLLLVGVAWTVGQRSAKAAATADDDHVAGDV